jgi:methyltransferase-like protein/cyclopropane fatty-acyl-phospholipid synthase-like methyltransferase
MLALEDWKYLEMANCLAAQSTKAFLPNLRMPMKGNAPPMSNEPQTSYDEVPYASTSFPQSHPDRLATLATLFGLNPPGIEKCRVLELGCASGGNLIPLAQDFPGSSFVGVDLSARQVADGLTEIEALGLKNIELRHLSIMDVDEDFGQFDYIIAHGVYSWVPDAVQHKVLQICKERLAENGVAYVSYNTYPGWRLRGMIRDMMRYHADQFEQSQVRVQQARALIDFLAQSVPTENNAYGMALKGELENLRKSSDSYLLHEHLEEVNEPVYFHQFAERAAQHGLKYLGEAEFNSMLASNFPPQVTETLRRVAPDIIRMEQYMDFLRNRTFRQTLLVHDRLAPNRNVTGERLAGLYVASSARALSERPDVRSDVREEFRSPSGATLATVTPITKAAMAVLAESWPLAMSFKELCRVARGRLEENPLLVPDAATLARDAEALGVDLLQCYTVGMIELRMHTPNITLQISDRPVASPLARRQAERGNTVTNLRHESLPVHEFNRHLLRLLDGSRDRDALMQALLEIVVQGALVVQQEGVPVTEETVLKATLGKALDENLPKLAQAALLKG